MAVCIQDSHYYPRIHDFTLCFSQTQCSTQTHEDVYCMSPKLFVRTILYVDFRTKLSALFNVDELIVIESLFDNKSEPYVNTYQYMKVNQGPVI